MTAKKATKRTSKVTIVKKSKRPIILVTNDDGITAPGLRALVETMKTLGKVVVVAPDSPQSGMGHAITLEKPLRLDKVEVHGETLGYQCSGTPVDCVKLAVKQILKRKPDICVSGINHGSNSSINVIYSGTMSAAMEGAIEGIPSIGFSLNNYSLDANLKASSKFAKIIAQKVIKHGMPVNTLLNVNIPNLSMSKIKGIKICRQAQARWEENFEERIDPRNRKYFWLKGDFIVQDKGADTDEWALKNGYVSVVPVLFDFTAHHASQFLNEIKWNA
jgi:5'-nucleotidase